MPLLVDLEQEFEQEQALLYDDQQQLKLIQMQEEEKCQNSPPPNPFESAAQFGAIQSTSIESDSSEVE